MKNLFPSLLTITLTGLLLLGGMPSRSPSVWWTASAVNGEEKQSTSSTRGDSNSKKDPAPTAPYVKLPATKTAKPSRYFCIKPDTNCTQVKWIIPSGLDKLDPEIPIKDQNVAVLIGDTGTYIVQCYGALGDQASDIASCTVTIGTTPPTPPGPSPDSGNDLTAGFQSAYNQDKDSDKATSLEFLQGVYSGLASQAASWTDVHTNGDALNKIKSVVSAPTVGLSGTQVVNLRKAIAAEMVKVFGSDSTTAIVLATLASELNHIAVGLKGVK